MAKGGTQDPIRKSAQRGGGPRMSVPGDGKIAKPKGTPNHEGRGAARHADEMIGGSAGEHSYEK